MTHEFSNAPRVGVGVIVTRGHRVLLIRRINAHGAGTWSTPGGHLDYGETPEACAIREVEEETGVRITGVHFRALTNDIFAESGLHYITLWMQGEVESGEAGIHAADEVGEIGWFKWETLPEPLFLPLANLLAGRCYPPSQGGKA